MAGFNDEMFIKCWIRSVPGEKLVAQTRKEVMEVDLVGELLTDGAVGLRGAKQGGAAAIPGPVVRVRGPGRYQHQWEQPHRN